MSIKILYDEQLGRQKKLLSNPMAKYWINQESRWVQPFQMYGNLYYVGDSWVCAHIVDTGDGLLLFDAGNCGNGPVAMLIQAIWEVGFNPRDVRWIVLSHGHVDHIGAVNFFKRMFGTKIYLGAQDAKMFREHPERALIHESTDYMDELFAPDVEIHDGDVIRFGNTEVYFRETPGHTPGVISCFFNVTDGKETKRVGYFGGFGFNTMQKAYLQEIGDNTYETRRIFLRSIEKVINEKVDLFMPNHCVNVDLLNKRQYMIDHPDAPNPFLDGTAWKKYLQMKYDDMVRFMADPAQL